MTFVETLTENWSIVTTVIGIIGSWFYFKFKIDELVLRIGKLEIEREVSDKTVSRLEIAIGEINAKLDILVEGYKQKKQ